MSKKYSIAICILYFGQLPSYFKIFLKSCENAPGLNFLFFSDCDLKGENLPVNFKQIHFTISDFTNLAGKKLGIPISYDIAPYKFCDFRPAYGLVLEDYLKGFDYWGFCDIDLILGRNMEEKLSPLLGDYDIINTFNRWMHGPLCFFKNLPKVNELFLQSADWKKVFTSPEHFAFDENGAKKDRFDEIFDSNKGLTSFIELEDAVFDEDIDCFSYVVYRNSRELKIYYEIEMCQNIPSRSSLSWNQGKITDSNGQELACYHWVREKKRNQFRYPDWHIVPDIYTINRYGFFDGEKLRLAQYLKILKQKSQGTIQDARDLVWLLRNGKLNNFYFKFYSETSYIITEPFRFLYQLERWRSKK